MKELYWSLVIWCVLQRLAELAYSKSNQRRLASEGFRFQEGRKLFQFMVLAHVTWFVGLFLEPVIFPREISPGIAVLGAAGFILGQLLRFWVLSSLGKHWNVTVMRPETSGEFVSHGPYRFIRHPNYLAVILEFISLPLVNGAVLTAIIGSLLNGIALYGRIKHEDAVLLRDEGYRSVMGKRAALLPGVF